MSNSIVFHLLKGRGRVESVGKTSRSQTWRFMAFVIVVRRRPARLTEMTAFASARISICPLSRLWCMTGKSVIGEQKGHISHFSLHTSVVFLWVLLFRFSNQLWEEDGVLSAFFSSTVRMFVWKYLETFHFPPHYSEKWESTWDKPGSTFWIFSQVSWCLGMPGNQILSHQLDVPSIHNFA